MALKDMIYRLRTEEKLSQARFAEIMGVSAQAVQKWESGVSVPELDKLIKIAHRFGVSLDSLALDRDMRAEEELPYSRKIHLPFSVSGYEAYSAVLPAEYRQCTDEGLDVSCYKDLFAAAAKMPEDENKERISDILFDITLNASVKRDYKYTEPSEYNEIVKLCKPYDFPVIPFTEEELEKKLRGHGRGALAAVFWASPSKAFAPTNLLPFSSAREITP